jgi:hypothetical protein
MPTVVAKAMRCGRAFSGAAGARVVGDVMIARVRAAGRSGHGGPRSLVTNAVTGS